MSKPEMLPLLNAWGHLWGLLDAIGGRLGG